MAADAGVGLVEIGRVASSAFAALKASPRPQIALRNTTWRVAILVLVRSTNRPRRRLTSGNSSLTSAVFGGHQEGGDRPVGLIEHDAKHDLLQMPAVVFGMPVLAQVLAAGSPRITMTSCR